jgi:release factor glutamine methyltransferase
MVYRPREDSRLLKEAITRLDLEGKKFLDMGTGTGYIAEAALDEGAEVTAADIDPEAVEAARNRLPSKVDVIQSDLFENVQDSFEVVAFNPPYLPRAPGGTTATVSGEAGSQVSRRFLQMCSDHVSKDGEVVLVTSSKNELQTKRHETLNAVRLWFERLEVIRIRDNF